MSNCSSSSSKQQLDPKDFNKTTSTGNLVDGGECQQGSSALCQKQKQGSMQRLTKQCGRRLQFVAAHVNTASNYTFV